MPQPLPPSQVYRQRAEQLEQAAAGAGTPEARAHYLRLAEEWRRLAESSEVMSRRWGGSTSGSPDADASHTG